jgi:hypothetical protein
MWNPFKKAQEEKDRADKLQVQLQELLEREQEREEQALEAQRLEDAKKAKEEEQLRLIQEEQDRLHAEKNLATENKEPWINIVSIDMEPGDGANVGAIEMDWNECFIEMLHKNGYHGVSDEDAVDQWFRDVCKHVVLETYENEDQGHKTNQVDLGDGRTEYS